MQLRLLIDYVSPLLLTCLLLALLLLQWRFPLRRQHFSALRRLVRNFLLSIPGFAVVRLAMLPIPLALCAWAQHRHIGLLNWLAPTGWTAEIVTFLLMDYAYWWWHRANHLVPFLWRFHNAHHTDLDLDVSMPSDSISARWSSRWDFCRWPSSSLVSGLGRLSFSLSLLTQRRFFIIRIGGCRSDLSAHLTTSL
jgi:hypothetical protein